MKKSDRQYAEDVAAEFDRLERERVDALAGERAMTKREAELKRAFTAKMKLLLPDFIMLQYSTAGAPDRSITANGRTTTWEFKHGTPQFKSPGIQELLCMRLAMEGHCRYVIWQEWQGIERTLIVHPRAVHHRTGWDLHLVAEALCGGFDMRWLVEQVRRAHLL